MEILNEIIAKVDAMKDDLIKQRRDIHRHPETGWTEFRTASLVAEKLSSYGYEVLVGEKAVKKDAMMGLPSDEALRNAQKRAVSEGANPDLVEKMTGGLTGVVGIFHFAKPGPVVALRCDMDCNDVTETSDEKHFPNQQGFSSTHEKEMHACGHDGHTTVGLAVAKILSEMKDELAGTFKIIFQPAEGSIQATLPVMLQASWLQRSSMQHLRENRHTQEQHRRKAEMLFLQQHAQRLIFMRYRVILQVFPESM